MSRRQSVRRQSVGWRHSAVLFVCAALIVLSGHNGQSQGSPPGLNYFKNFFVTGNYVTASVDFGSQSGGSGFVEAEINFDQPEEMVPAGADVIGAFLYWQTIVDASPLPVSGVEFRGEDISEIAKQVTVPAVSLDPSTSPCWSGGGQGTYEMMTFRADVLRFLPVPLDEDGNPIGKRLVNLEDLDDPYPNAPGGFGPHTVKLPDNGTGNQTPQTAGASLVVIYRLPTEPLTSIVLYDGLQIKPSGATTTSQTLRGFYQATTSPPGPTSKLTLLVGSGAKNGTEQVLFGRGLSTDPIVATNPFFTRDSNSPGSDRAWDGPTWDVSSVMPAPPVTTAYGEQATVQIKHTNATPYDCLATSAIVFSTTVQDTDFDGLLDVWETGDVSDLVPTHAPLLDPADGQPLPDLYAMGANPNDQDIFVEVGFMSSGAYNDPLNPAPGGVAAHTHLPSQAVLDNVASVFANAAPRKNPADVAQTKSGAIKIHFDVGNRYQASPNVINAAYARGGEEIPETEACPVPTPPAEPTCSFPGFRGVVGWKLGYRLLRDQPLSHPDEAACEAAGLACVRRFDRNRRHMFRYVLFAHVLGVPREDDPGTAIDESRFPKSISGVSDAGNGGGDLAITLGMWDNNTGTEFIQASTLVHELGHTMGLRHGGSAPTPLNPAPNCKPNYESVMSYLFQIRGLIGLTGPKIDLSRQVLQLADPVPGQPLADLDESDLTETALKQGGSAALYPTRWYAPLAGSFLDGLVGTTASTRHCDGTPLDPANPADNIPGGMVRVDGAYPVGAVDWNASGTITAGAFSQDINFNGDGIGTTLDPAADGVFTGWNDWEHLDLRQTGSRRNPASLSLEVTVEDLASAGDPGYGDPGYGDPGYGDPGYGDPGYGDPGYGDPGYGDPGYGDPGYGDPGYGDPGYGGEVDVPGAESQGPGANTLSYTTTNRSIDVKWLPPTAGGPVASYHVWRALGTISPGNLPADITPAGIVPGTICNAATQAILCDRTTQNNRTYQYFVVTWFANGKKSRSETITASR